MGTELAGAVEGRAGDCGRSKVARQTRMFLTCRFSSSGPAPASGCEGKLGVALESLQGLRDLT